MITLSQGQLELSNATIRPQIDGPTAALTVSGGGASRVFQIDPGVTATLSGLTITGGSTSGPGGGVFNQGTATLYGCTVSGNTARLTAAACTTPAPPTLTGCTFSGNSASAAAALTTPARDTDDSHRLHGQRQSAKDEGGGL